MSNIVGKMRIYLGHLDVKTQADFGTECRRKKVHIETLSLSQTGSVGQGQ